MKDIKDYLHLYCGQKCAITWKPIVVYDDGIYVVDWFVLNNMKRADSIVPHLRPLSDMTEEEAKQMIDFDAAKEMYGYVNVKVEKNGIKVEYSVDVDEQGPLTLYYDIEFYKLQPEYVKYLLSKGFDLFGLHEAGLCLYKSDLK